jgi:O-antigen ligase
MRYLPGSALLLASWLQPLHVMPWVSWHSEILGFAAIAYFFAVELFTRIKSRRPFLAVPRVALAPLALGMLALTQLGVGQIQFFGDALAICFYLSSCALAMTAAYAWTTPEDQPQDACGTPPVLEQLAFVTLIGAVASVLIALVQVFNVWQNADWIVRIEGFRRPGANIGQPNNLATLLLMGVASLALLFESKRVSSTLAVILLALLTWGLALSESRTGLLSGAALTAWWFYKRRIFPTRIHAALLAAAWGSWLFLMWAWPRFIAHVQGVELQHGSINTAPGGRLLVWPQLFEAVMQHPWMGWGLREVSKAHNAVLDHYAKGEPYAYAHNLVLDLALGVGLPLTALILGLTSYWAWRRMKAVSASGTWYCIALAVPLAVHSMLEYPFAYIYLLAPAVLAIGVLEAKTAPGANIQVSTRGAALAAACLLLIMLWSAVEYVAAEEDFRIARFEALRVGRTQSDYTRPKLHLLTQMDTMLTATRIAPSLLMSPADIELLHSAAMRFPWTAIQNRYALALALNGNPDEAIRQLRVMRAMHGEKHYQALKETWKELAAEKYPQLGQLKLP